MRGHLTFNAITDEENIFFQPRVWKNFPKLRNIPRQNNPRLNSRLKADKIV